MSKDRRTAFRDAGEDRTTAAHVPDTPQTRSPSYRLAFADDDFLCQPALRPVRLQLELMKFDMLLDAAQITSTVVLFGGARIRESAEDAKTPEIAALTPFYAEARRFAALVTEWSKKTNNTEWVVCTGGGPGVMEAGNRGAADAGGVSLGLNIVLPHEQAPNPYVTPELTFNFHYFAMRKMHFLMRARAVCAFPGGFGTMDELFEALTLIQTGRMDRVPVILFGKAFWDRTVDWTGLADAGLINRDDLDLFRYADTADEAIAILETWQPAPPREVIPGR